MLNHSLRTIFIHVPKTGGTSIKNSLGGFSTELGYHKRGLVIYKRFPRLWTEYFRFSFVRNPYDRMVSIFSFYKMGKKVSLVDPNRLPNTFNEFALAPAENLDILGLSYTQDEFIGTEIDFIGKFEALEGDFARLCSILHTERRLKHDRRSPRNQSIEELYTPKTQQAVYEFFRRDFDRFGYSSELPC